MSVPLQKEPQRYTYEDYKSWPESCHIELIDGLPYRYGELITDLPKALTMSAAPARMHQEISIALASQLYGQLKRKPCKAYTAPFEVKLQLNEEDGPIVEPDIVVVCDPSKLTKRGCEGAPDMIIEILSPSTGRYDRLVKLDLYQQAGVKEYWIIDPNERTVQVNLLRDGQYVLKMYGDNGTIPVAAAPGCSVDMQEVFSSANDSAAGQNTE